MKKILVFTILFLAFVAAANAQNKENYSYRDLINQQKIERDELKQTQKEILDKILQRQKEELEAVSGNSGPVQAMQDKHQAERENIVKLLTSEREKQMQIQADERKQFALSHK